jgi:hypothetical protein
MTRSWLVLIPYDIAYYEYTSACTLYVGTRSTNAAQVDGSESRRCRSAVANLAVNLGEFPELPFAHCPLPSSQHLPTRVQLVISPHYVMLPQGLMPGRSLK